MDTSRLAHTRVGSYINSDIACGILGRERVASDTDGHTKCGIGVGVIANMNWGAISNCIYMSINLMENKHALGTWNVPIMNY